jgi:hypothetical protein
MAMASLQEGEVDYEKRRRRKRRRRSSDIVGIVDIMSSCNVHRLH